ncbi:MAG: GNAT family N-acetyltransferase [Acidithiobacillus sp.]
MTIRHIEYTDFDVIVPVVDEWWGGRAVRGLLPRLFFEHFQPTSFVVEENERLVGFLVGFQSQSNPTVGYIHFIGVHPDARTKGYGRLLYQHFFAVIARLGCTEVRAVTSPANESSVRFHSRLGFQLLPGNGNVNGYPVCLDHDGPGHHHVLFSRQLTEAF